jgi:hypothetical protein
VPSENGYGGEICPTPQRTAFARECLRYITVILLIKFSLKKGVVEDQAEEEVDVLKIRTTGAHVRKQGIFPHFILFQGETL